MSERDLTLELRAKLYYLREWLKSYRVIPYWDVRQRFDEIDAALDLRDTRLTREQAWQPIETAPKDGTVILYAGTTDGIIHWVTCGRWNEDGWYEINLDYSDIHGHADYPMMWRPLPDPPQAEPKSKAGEPVEKEK
jgi:hypothetical protein